MIIAGVSETNRDQMSRLLASSGFSVYRCCSSASSLRRALSESDDSIVVFMGIMPDCTPDDLILDYGSRIQVLWIAKPNVLESCDSPEIFRLTLPTSGQTILGALEMLNQLHRRQMPRRTGAEKELVEEAKSILMKQLNITEPEAHHLLQKQAMDHGMKMTEYAGRIVKRGP
jgi:response regulator NasT